MSCALLWLYQPARGLKVDEVPSAGTLILCIHFHRLIVIYYYCGVNARLGVIDLGHCLMPRVGNMHCFFSVQELSW
jgi:hypothetical protein